MTRHGAAASAAPATPVGPSAEELLALVRAHRPADPREARATAVFARELTRLGSPGDRFADPVHVTASGIVVGTPGTVLHRHRKIGRYMQPGGHLEPGEMPEDAARREAREETGLPVEHPSAGPCLLHLDVHEAGGHVHLDLRYLVVSPALEPSPAATESQEVSWFAWPEAHALADDALVGALRAAERWVAEHPLVAEAVSP